MRQRILLFLVLVGLVGIGYLWIRPVTGVQAGGNGQQVQVWVSCEHAPVMAEVVVRGYDQNGKWSEWYAAPNSKSATTWGWWWKGTVYIAFRYAGINPATEYSFTWYGLTNDYVPEKYDQDVYLVDVSAGQRCNPYPW